MNLEPPNCVRLSFCQTLETMIAAGGAVGRSGKRFPDIAAVSTLNNLVVLRNLTMSMKPARTLEIGLAFGGSCLAFLASHRDLGRPPDRQHIALDPFQSSVWDDCGIMAAERAELDGYLDFRAAYSCYELPRLAESGDSFDLVYVDGSHLFEDVFVDFYFVVRLLSPGGIVAFDDSGDRHVRKVISFIRSNRAEGLAEVDLLPFRRDRRNRFRYRVAHAVHRTQLTAFRKIGDAQRAWNSRFAKF